jgi:hypothetical protein
MYLSTQRNLPRDPHGAAFLPFLAGEMSTVSALSIRRGGAVPSVTVQKQSDQWTVKERGGYPADLSKVRKLLLALSDAKIVEEKTSNPASFPIIGVEDPSVAGATGAEVTITAQDGKHSVIIGKTVGEGSFARRGGEDKSYSVEPAINIDAEPRAWIDTHLLDVPAADIQSMQVKPAAGPAYSIHHAAAADHAAAGDHAPAGDYAPAGGGDFVLDGVPPGRKPVDSASLAPSPTTYSGLTADDVAAASDIDFSKATVVTVTLTGGKVLTLTGAVSGDKHWVRLEASKDAALTAKVMGRAFELSGYRYDAIFRPLETLLVPKEAPPGAKKSGTAVGSATSPALIRKKPLPAPSP